MKAVHVISFILVVIGGLNWGLVGAANWNLVEAIFGMGAVAKIVYILVGLSAIVLVATHKKSCGDCTAKSATPTM